MSEPIKIVVTAQTQDAMEKLSAFTAQAGMGFRVAKTAAEHATGAFGANRMALMELGHVGRSMADGLMAGISPMRMLAMESPRIAQSFGEMGIKLSTMLPYLGAVAAAAAVLGIEWYAMVGHIEDSTKETEKFISAMDKVPEILQKISTLTKAGLMSPAAGSAAADYLTGRRKLYTDPAGQITTQPTSQSREMNITGGGPVAFSTPGKEITVDNPVLTDQQKINDWVSKNHMTQASDEQAKAIVKNRELEQKAHEEKLSEIDKEKAKIHDEYEAKRQEILETAKIEGAPLTAGGVRDPQVDARAAAAVADLNGGEQNAIAAVQAKVDKKAQDEADQALEKQGHDLLAQIEQMNREMDNELATEKQQSEELDRQVTLRREIADEGIKLKMAELQATDMSPQAKAAAMEKLLQDESALYDAQVKELETSLQQTTDLTKRLEIQKQILAIRIEQANLAPKEEKQDTSFGGNLTTQWNDLSKKVGDLAKDMASVVTSPLAGLQTGLDNAFNKLFEKGETAKQFFGQVGLSIYQSMTRAFSNMVSDFVTSTAMMLLKWIYTQTTMTVVHAIATHTQVATHAAGQSQMTIFTMLGSLARQGWHLAETIFHGLMVAIRVAAHEAGEILCTAITGAQAMIRAIYHAIVAAIGAIESLSSVPYVGVVLGIAAGAAIMAAAEGMMGGFIRGGYTGDGPDHQVAGVVHRGEFVVPAGAVRSMGIGSLQAMVHGSSRGTSSTPSGSSHPAGNNVSVYAFHDSRQLADHLEKNPDHEKWVVDVMNRNIHKFR